MIVERIKECVGLMMIGEGVMAVTRPREYARFWQSGPAWWHRVIEPFVRSPDFTRVVGAADILAGYWLATSQLTASDDRSRSRVPGARLGYSTSDLLKPVA